MQYSALAKLVLSIVRPSQYELEKSYKISDSVGSNPLAGGGPKLLFVTNVGL